ncbi:MAG: YjbH domain-containing protein [Synergistaceae bacterium]|nr:YjbH domain-containing protein [Synergistaceae bacterium]
MQKAVKILLGVALLAGASGGVALASTASNNGVTGLWEYPSAEMPDDGVGRFGYTYDTPYAYYFLDMAYLPWLEINARFTLFDSIGGGAGEGRRYIDKALDLKAMLWRNKNPKLWYLPSIAGGVADIMGTELMKSWYWVATWRWGDLAATVGWGTDRLNGVFGGLEWDVNNWLTVKAEYSPLDYTRDVGSGQRVLKEGPSQKYNVGIVLKTPFGLEGSVSYQRGDEWAFTISQRLNFDGTLLGASRKHINTPDETRIPCWDSTTNEEILAKLKSGLEKYTRVRDVDLKLEETEEGHKLSVAYENYGYSSHAEAMVRLLILLSEVMPETTELVLIQKNAGIPIVKASFPGELLFDIRARCLREEDSLHSAVFTWAAKELEDADEEHILRGKAQNEVKAMLVYEPRIDQTLTEEYMDRWSIDLLYNGRYSHGWDGIIDIRFPFYVHADTGDGLGLWWEKDFNDKIRIQNAAMMYANHFGSEGRFWLIGEGGYLDEEWFGLNLWSRYYGRNGKWWLGTRLSEFRDRDPYSFGGLVDGRYRYFTGGTAEVPDEEEWRTLAFVQGGYHFTDLDVDVQVDYGKFADGDKGFKYSVVRHWDDLALGFWYIDTDVHTSGKDFTRAGVHMEIPAERWFGSWFGNSSAYIWEQNTILQSTWESEAGRDLGVIRTPERMMSQLRPIAMKRNVERLLNTYCSYSDDENQSKLEEDALKTQSLLEYIVH